MKFALIVDSCKVGSYLVRDRKAYKLSDPEVPYQFHHSVSNECFIGFWGYPFVFDGCFINWSEWNELPDLDLNTIFVVIEKRFDECKIEHLRKKYPNAIIIGLLKELWNWKAEWWKRMEVFNQCDKVFTPISDINLFPELVQNCSKDISFLPQPVDIDYLYDNFYSEYRDESIFVYNPVHNFPRQGNTFRFAEYISRKYNIPYFSINTQDKENQWHEFLKQWTSATFHFNLDPIPVYPGQQAMQCAALGIIQIGGVNDSHHFLWPETATCDEKVLEEKFVEYLNDYEKRVTLIQTAFERINKVYSFKAIKNKFEEII